MKMFIKKRDSMRAHQGLLTPEAAITLNKNKYDSVGTCKCFGSGMQYEVDCLGKTYVVDLNQKTCGCNRWDLTGIPCVHAICCIVKIRADVLDFVHPYYHKETFLKVYEGNVNPMPGEDQWEKTNNPPLEPPSLVVQPGRPKKLRRKETGEGSGAKKVDPNKQTRVRHGKNKCGNCHEIGHTRKSCKNPTKPPPLKEAPKTGGRPPSEDTLPIQPRKRKYTHRQVCINCSKLLLY